MSFMIWRRGAWVRLDSGRGTLESGEKMKFVYVREGKLRVASRRRVLRLMQDMQHGRHPAALRASRPLPHVPVRRDRHHRKRPVATACPGHTACCVQTAANPLPCKRPVATACPGHTACCVQTAANPLPCQQAPSVAQPSTSADNHKAEPTQPPKTTQSAPIIYLGSCSSDDVSQQAPCKELLLDCSDVILIKDYLDKNPEMFGALDSELFQEDEGYRSGVLFLLQPLVKIERLSPIQDYLNKKMNLKEFAYNLGLKHIDDANRETRAYRTRKQIKKKLSGEKRFLDIRSNKENYVGVTSESETDGVSSTPPRKGKHFSQKEIDDLLNEPKNLRWNRKERRESLRVKKLDGDNRGNASTGSEKANAKERDDKKSSARFFKSKTRANRVRSGRVTKPVVFTSGVSREYSPLEDHAIVAWLHAGRSRLVNGNRVWRQLQDSYTNITGQRRTWQSLRNRYLRYILPTLSNLHLEHKMEESLRANAALGELKLTRKKSMTRRNSIFKNDQIHSAWSRLPRTQGLRAAATSPQRAPRTLPGHKLDTAEKKTDEGNRSLRKRTKASIRDHSSSSGDEFQPAAKRHSDEKRTSDIRRLAQRLMRSPRAAATKNVPELTKTLSNSTKSESQATKSATNLTKTVPNSKNVAEGSQKTLNLKKRVSHSAESPKSVPKSPESVLSSPKSVLRSKNVSNRADSPPKSVLRSKNVTNRADSPPKSVLRSKNVSNRAVSPPKSVLRSKNDSNAADSPSKSVLSSPKLLSSRKSLAKNSSFNSENLRSPRVLGGKLYVSPTISPTSSTKLRLSADKHMAKEGTRRRPLYNHRAIEI